MAGHIYSEIYLHMNWHVEKDMSVLTGEVEQYVHQHMKSRCTETKGVYFLDVNGDDRHVHLVVRIEPHVNISELIGNLKGSSSHDTNERFRRKILSWQRGYGVVSFGKRNLEWVLTYVRNQRDHHAKGTLHPRMEACKEELDVSDENASLVREEEAGYPIS
jgi:REP element-mobilizing transposase RayT